MKKKNLTKLSLNKKSISNLNALSVKGGIDAVGIEAGAPTYQKILCFTNTSRFCPSEEYCVTSKAAVICITNCLGPIDI